MNEKIIEEIFELAKKGEKEFEKEFKDFDFKKKEDIIKNTYNIKTLEKWQVQETDTAIRIQIDKRIQGITDKKIKETYGKPDNHI